MEAPVIAKRLEKASGENTHLVILLTFKTRNMKLTFARLSSCMCPLGYDGQFCEVDVDDCVDNKCENGTICVDGVGNYTCVCPHPFSGTY